MINISCNFLKYFSKFPEKIVQIFRNDLIIKIFLNNSWKFPKYFFKFSENFRNILIFFEILKKWFLFLF